MRNILFLIILLMPISSYAADHYEEKANPIWRTNIDINENTTLRSQMVLGKSRIDFISKIYDLSKYHFFDFTKINPKKCYSGNLVINIVSEDDLDNREYFPYEKEYSGEDLFVLGRFYKHKSMMYIVPPHLGIYYWRKTFSHELLHYFYNDCLVEFKNDKEEHKKIRQFMRAKRKWFY